VGIKVFFVYARRRTNCPTCGIHAEVVPWAPGKHHLTTTLCWFLARWAKRLSLKEVAEVFQTSWSSVFRAVRWRSFGNEHVHLSGIKAVGIDEIQWQCGHHYLTLVYQIDEHCKRLLWIGNAWE
jgi:transposase